MLSYSYTLFIAKPSAVQNAPPHITKLPKPFGSMHLYVVGDMLAHPNQKNLLQVVQRTFNEAKSTAQNHCFEVICQEIPAVNRINYIDESARTELQSI